MCVCVCVWVWVWVCVCVCVCVCVRERDESSTIFLFLSLNLMIWYNQHSDIYFMWKYWIGLHYFQCNLRWCLHNFNKVYVGESKKRGKVCCKFIKKNKLIFQKCLRKNDKNNTFILEKLCPELSEISKIDCQ